MSYNSLEQSIFGSKPVELYRFTRGLQIWTYTTADTPITYNSEVYTPQVMRRDTLAQNNERNNATLDVYLELTIDVVADFISGASPGPTSLSLIRRHRDDASPAEQAVLFLGQVGSVEFTETEAKFTCVPFQDALNRRIPRILYQVTCNHMLYDPHCTVNPAGFTATGSIAAIVGRTVTVVEAALQPDGYYNGGWLKDGTTFAFIQTHASDQLLLLNRPPQLKVGDAISITAGCDRTQATCIAKFNNLPNFLGWPYIPDRNPYATNITGV